MFCSSPIGIEQVKVEGSYVLLTSVSSDMLGIRDIGKAAAEEEIWPTLFGRKTGAEK